MDNKSDTKLLFSVGGQNTLPADTPVFQVYGELFHALPPTGADFEEGSQMDVTSFEGNDQQKLKEQLRRLAAMLARRAVVRLPVEGEGEPFYAPNPNPPGPSWFWERLTMPEIAELLNGFTASVLLPAATDEQAEEPAEVPVEKSEEPAEAPTEAAAKVPAEEPKRRPTRPVDPAEA